MTMTIASQIFVGRRHLLLELVAPSAFERSVPGQFVHVRIVDSYDPLLRRPLSIYDISGDKKKGCRVKILYEIVGKGTQILSEKEASSRLDVLGPLGNGFDMKAIAAAGHIFLVAGGMGIAPLHFLAKRLLQEPRAKGQRPKVDVLIGGRTKEHVLCEKEFKELGCDVHVATDDGSKGFEGRVTELLKTLLPKAAKRREPGIICSCGPKPMLVVLSQIGRERQMPVRVSLEEFMGCGLGACLGCVVRTTSGYRRICHDGPVFDAAHIIWKE